jgi:hypothetical protein
MCQGTPTLSQTYNSTIFSQMFATLPIISCPRISESLGFLSSPSSIWRSVRQIQQDKTLIELVQGPALGWVISSLRAPGQASLVPLIAPLWEYPYNMHQTTATISNYLFPIFGLDLFNYYCSLSSLI